MSLETLLEKYHERATVPLRNTIFDQRNKGPFEILHVIEDDEFRVLNHRIVYRDGAASSIWRQQQWGSGDCSIDVTQFDGGVVNSVSIRYAGNAVFAAKFSVTRPEWLIADPDFRLPYIFGRTDMEAWYYTHENRLVLSRVRLAFDYSTKHTFTVLDQGVEKKTAVHLYRDVEYRCDLDDGIRLTIDGKSPRRVHWRQNLSADDARAIFKYARGYRWLGGWRPVADIVEI